MRTNRTNAQGSGFVRPVADEPARYYQDFQEASGDARTVIPCSRQHRRLAPATVVKKHNKEEVDVLRSDRQTTLPTCGIPVRRETRRLVARHMGQERNRLARPPPAPVSTFEGADDIC
jgi:hypothetical protein